LPKPFRHEIAPGLVIRRLGIQRADAGAGHRSGRRRPRAESMSRTVFPSRRVSIGTASSFPNGMDGVVRSQPKGYPAREDLQVRVHAAAKSETQMYHPHFDEMLQMGMGMMGMFVIHPRDPEKTLPSTVISR